MKNTASVLEFPAGRPAGSSLGSLDSYSGQFLNKVSPSIGRERSSIERPHTNTTTIVYPDGVVEVTGSHFSPATGLVSRPPATKEEKDKRASSRARGIVLQKAHYFGLCYLWTLTYRGPRFDREQVLRHWYRFCALVRRHFPEFRAIMVLERHHGGGANDGGYHLHFALDGFYAVQVLRACWYEVLGFGPDGCTLGQIDVAPGKVGRRGWQEVGRYISKYITKDIQSGERKKNEHYYYQTGDLEIPLVEKSGDVGREKNRIYHGSPFYREKEIWHRLLFLTGKIPSVWHSEDGFEFKFSTG